MTKLQEPPEPQPEEATDEPLAPDQPERGSASASALEGLELSDYLKTAWEATTRDFVTIVVGYLVMAILLTAAMCTIVGGFLVFGPFLFGYLALIRKSLNGKETTLGDIFDGFKEFQKPFVTGALFLVAVAAASLASVLLAVFVPCIGRVAAPLLGLFACAMLYFVLPIAVFSDASSVEAHKRSFEFCLAHMWAVLLLCLVTLAIMAAGVLVCGFGLLVTAPLGIVINVVAYNEYYLKRVA